MDAWLVNALKEGGMFALACVSLWILNKVWADRLAEAQRNACAEKESKEEYKALVANLQQIIEDNTRVIAVFLERTQAHRSPRKSRAPND